MRIGILSDVHSNLSALNAVFEDAKGRVDDFWFLGDAIGYGLQPVETLQMLSGKVRPENMIKGNHEAIYAKEPLPDPDIKVGIEAQLMMQYTRHMVKEAGNCTLPGQADGKKQLDGVNYYLVHSVENIYEYIYYWDGQALDKFRTRIAEVDFPKKRRSIFSGKESDITIVLFGHSHLPGIVYLDPDENKLKTIQVRSGTFKQKEDCKNSKLVMLNPGSVGFPRDWIPYPSYLILDTRKLVFEFRRLDTYRMDSYVSGYDDVVRNIRKYMYDGISRNDAENHIHKLQAAVGKAGFPKDEFTLPKSWSEFYLESKTRFFSD